MRESPTLMAFVKLFVRSAQDDRVTFLAAGIAFYAILSLFPLLLLVLAIGSAIGGEAFAQTIIEQLSGILTAEAEAVLEDALLADAGRSGASLVGLGFLLWSSLKVFRGLDVAFSQIYSQSPNPGFLETIGNALLVFASIAIAVIAMLAIRGYLQLVDLPPTVRYLTPVLVFVTIAIVLYPMFYVFPNHDQSPRSIVPGTAFAAFGWTLLGELFGIYAANAGTYALFGLIGGVLLLLMWFYFGAIIVLLGAVINAVLAGKYRAPNDEEEVPVLSVIGKDQ